MTSVGEKEDPFLAARRQAISAAAAAQFPELCGTAAALIAMNEGGRKQLRDINVATEIVNEAVCRAMEKASEFDLSRPAKHWLTGFMMNVIRETKRARIKERSQSDLAEETWIGLLETLAVVGSPDASSKDAEYQRVMKAMEQLPEAARHLLKLHFMQGLNGKELADAVGATPGATRVRVYRAILKLREVLASTGGTEVDQ